MMLIIEDALVNWALHNIPTISFCLALMWLTWWVRGGLVRFSIRFTALEQKVSRIAVLEQNVVGLMVTCDNLSTKIDRTNARLDDMIAKANTRIDDVAKNTDIRFNDFSRKTDARFNEFSRKADARFNEFARKLDDLAEKTNNRFDRVEERLTSLIVHLASEKHIPLNVVNARSPIELTDNAWKLLREMGGQQYVDDNFGELLRLMEKSNPKSGLDVQNRSTILLFEKFNDDALIPVRDFIFNTPVYHADANVSFQLNMHFAITIMSVYLRNKYFEVHPKLNQGLSPKRLS